jgi:probable rRNA maturation factor
VNIELRNLQRKYKVAERLIKGKAKTILLLCGLDNTELNILIVNNKRIRLLNKRYRGIDRSTDVLAFPIGEIITPGLLGDIVISMEKAHRQAEEQGHSINTELLFLLTHGILHLIGYDHEISSLEEKRMKRKENFIISRI